MELLVNRCVSRRLLALFEGYIEQCVQNDEESFVNSYVKSFGPQYDAEQLNFILRDFLVAGSETTMTTLLWSLIYLANHPEWQKRLQEQVREHAKFHCTTACFICYSSYTVENLVKKMLM
jgi:cytochrome P450